MGASSPVSQALGPCPCLSCEVQGTKLTKYGHLVGCGCRSCMGRRVRRSGRRAQAKGYRLLGGSAPFTPGQEENAGTFSIEVQAEMKSGAQIPASFLRFTRLEWTRRALSQAARAIPEGVQAHESVYLDAGRDGRWLVVRLP